MDMTKDPLGLILLIGLFAMSLYAFSPRLFRFLFIGMGLSLWQSKPPSYKEMVMACTRHNGVDIDWECKVNVGSFGVQIVVYTVAVMCALAQVDDILARGSGIVRRERAVEAGSELKASE